MNSDVRLNAIAICDALYEKNAEDIVLIDIADRSIIADCFVICTGRNNLQVQAFCDEVEDKMSKRGMELRRTEGYREGRWIVMDFSDILVHIFHAEERKYYNMERLWKDDTNFLDFSASKQQTANS